MRQVTPLQGDPEGHIRSFSSSRFPLGSIRREVVPERWNGVRCPELVAGSGKRSDSDSGLYDVHGIYLKGGHVVVWQVTRLQRWIISGECTKDVPMHL